MTNDDDDDDAVSMDQMREHDKIVMRFDADIIAWERKTGGTGNLVSPLQRRAFRAGLERAAQECEAQTRPHIASDGETFSETIVQCAAAIRKLMEE